MEITEKWIWKSKYKTDKTDEYKFINFSVLDPEQSYKIWKYFYVHQEIVQIGNVSGMATENAGFQVLKVSNESPLRVCSLAYCRRRISHFNVLNRPSLHRTLHFSKYNLQNLPIWKWRAQNLKMFPFVIF